LQEATERHRWIISFPPAVWSPERIGQRDNSWRNSLSALKLRDAILQHLRIASEGVRGLGHLWIGAFNVSFFALAALWATGVASLCVESVYVGRDTVILAVLLSL
jgi:hypothetical protein